jgi:ribosomal protein S18 acetylase RimI-like enzyme
VADADVRIEQLDDVDRELVDAVGRLLPQLSSSASSLSGEDLQRIVDAEATVVLVARIDGRTVGWLTLVVFTIPTGVRAWIEDVVVDEDVRGRGIGKALTLRALELAATSGARTVDLTSRPSRHAANAMYESLGFRRRDTNVYRYELPTD